MNGRFCEPEIVINGRALTPVQAMTVRVAINFFAVDLADRDSLGADEAGRRMTAGYRARVKEVIAAMAIPPPA